MTEDITHETKADKKPTRSKTQKSDLRETLRKLSAVPELEFQTAQQELGEQKARQNRRNREKADSDSDYQEEPKKQRKRNKKE